MSRLDPTSTQEPGLTELRSPALPRPVYLLAPPSVSAADVPALPGRELQRLTSSDDLAGAAPGVVLLHPELPAEQVLAAILAVAARPGPWLSILLRRGPTGVDLVPLSLGWPTKPETLASWADGAAGAEVLELRHVLARVARGRHDLNNPLTSAMAETQLALMDVKEPEIRAGLETIEEQLRRMRDLIASLRSIRAPD